MMIILIINKYVVMYRTNTDNRVWRCHRNNDLVVVPSLDLLVYGINAEYIIAMESSMFVCL